MELPPGVVTPNGLQSRTAFAKLVLRKESRLGRHEMRLGAVCCLGRRTSSIFFFLFSMFPFEGFESVAFLVWCFGSRRFTCYSVVTVRRYVFFCLYLFVVLFPLRVSSRSRNAVGRPVSSESECKERAGRESTAVWKSRVASPNSLNLRLIRELNSVTYFAFLRLSPPLG